MFHDDAEFETGANSKKPYLPDLHLKTAIRIHKRRLFKGRLLDPLYPCPGNIAHEVISLSPYILKNEDSLNINSENAYPILWSYEDYQSAEKHVLTGDLHKANKIAKDYVSESIKKLYADLIENDTLLNSNIEDISMNIKHYKPSIDIEKLNKVRYFWSSVRTKMSHLQIDRSTKVIKDEYINKTKFTVSYSGNFCICNIKSVLYLLDYDQVLLISDTSTSRYLTFLACDIIMHLNQKGYPNPETLKKVYSWGDDILTKLGNSGYKLIKLFEAMCTSHFLENYEPLQLSKNFGDSIRRENKYYIKELDALRTILRENVKSVNELFEIFGLYRHFGHPTVNEAGGCKKMLEYTRKEIDIDDYACREVYGAFVLSFITEFIRKTNRWPKTYLESEPNCRIFEKIYQEQPLNLQDYIKKIPIVEWSLIRFKKELEFDYHEDFTDLLLDTSISPYKKNWVSVFHPQLLTCHPPRDIKEKRRLLEEVLSRNTIDVEKICKMIMENKVPDSWKIVGLHSKEREMKIDSRLFAMMVFEMRMYFCVTEKNLKSIFKYTTGQTMTMSETELIQHLYRVTKSDENGIRIPIVVSIDFTKWNNVQRKESNQRIFQAFDDLFGTSNLYVYTHDFFEESSFYLSSNLRPPSNINREIEYVTQKQEDPESTKKTTDPKVKKFNNAPSSVRETETSWVGQLGGCEGLRQKGWTSGTNALLKLIEHLIGIESVITGQGDNQVLVAMIPVRVQGTSNEEYIKKYKHLLEEDIEVFLLTLSEYSKKIGLEIKTEESWVSLYHFNFGKEILYKGCFNSGMLKKISRTYQSVSESYPSLPNRLASLSTATHAACGKSFCLITPLYIQIMETSLLFLTEVKLSVTMRSELKSLMISERILMNNEFISFLIHFPLFAGGYPISNPLDFLYRGHPDTNLTKLRWLYKNRDISIPRNILEWIMSGDGISEDVDPQSIIQDPYAFNFKKPIATQNIIKNMMIQVIDQNTKNKDLHYLIRARSEEKYKAELNFLFNIIPCSPRVLNDILRNTPEGAANMFINTFGDMRTIKGLLSGNQGNLLIKTLKDTDLSQFKFLIKIFKYIKLHKYRPKLAINFPSSINHNKYLDKLCTRELSQHLRDKGFKKEIHHVTTPHPDEQFRLYRVNSSSSQQSESSSQPQSSNKERITLIYIPPTHQAQQEEPKSLIRGNEEPYCGSKTSEKRGSKLIPFDKANRPLKAAQNLSRLLGWIAEENTEVYHHIEDLISSRTDTPIEILTKMSGINYGGDLSHRFADVITKHACRPNMRVNVFSCIYISSDTMGKYGRGLENWTILYQSAFLYALSLIAQAIEFGALDPTVRQTFFLEVKCDKCFILLEEERFQSPNKRIKVHQLRKSKVIFVPYEKIKKDIPEKSIDKTMLVSANEESRTDSTILSAALASSIYGDALISDFGSKNDQDLRCNSLRKLQVLTFSTISRCNLRECSLQFGLLWLYDNLYDILRKSIEMRIPINILIKIHAVSVFKRFWKSLLPFLSTPEMVKKLKEEMNLSISVGESRSSHAVSLDILSKESSRILSESRVIKPTLYFCPKGLPFPRIVSNWTSYLAFSLLNLSNKKLASISDQDKKKILKIKRYFNTAVKDSSSEAGIDMRSLLANMELYLCTNNIETMRLRHQDKMYLSEDGPEVWFKNPKTKEEKPDISKYICSHQRIPLSSIIKLEDKKILTSYPRIHINMSRIPENKEPLLKPEGIVNAIRTKSSDDEVSHIQYTPLYLSYQGKLTGKTTGCHYKYLQVFLKFISNPPKLVLNLADGSGGISRLCLELWSNCSIWYNSLVSPEHHYQHRVVNYVPPELVSFPKNRIRGIEESMLTGGDLREKRVETLIAKVASTEGFDIITFDLETSYEDYEKTMLEVLPTLFQISKKNCKSHHLIIKTYWRNNKLLVKMINLMLASCENLEIYKPHMSEPCSGEIFLIGYTSIAAIQASLVSLMELDRILFSENQLMTLIESLRSEKRESDILFSIFDTATKIFVDRGYPYNLSYHITVLFGQWVSHKDFSKNLIKTLSESITVCLDYLNTLTKSRCVIEHLFEDKEGTTQRSQTKTNKKISLTEISKEVQTNMEFLYNLTTFRRFIMYPEEISFLPIIKVSYEGASHLVYRHDPFRWNVKFGRSFQAIKGHIRMGSVF